MFKRILHIFWIHAWSKWSAPISETLSGGLISAFSGEQVEIYQQRTCEVCNLIEQTRVGVQLQLGEKSLQFLRELNCDFDVQIKEDEP